MLKFKLTKEEFDALDEAQKSMYAESGEGYQLAIEGLPDVSGLSKKVDELLGEKKAEQEKRRAAEELAKKSAEEQARKSGDIESLEKSWADKLAAKETELLAQIQERDGRLHTLLVDNEAQRLAAELAGDNAALILPHIKSRLAVEEGKTRVLDISGKPSASSLDDLSKEFRTNKLFAPVIISSKASGTSGADDKDPVARGDGYKPKNTDANPLISRAREIIAKTQE
ncbi:hypothetical protein [Pragia fontium]|uniref:hypothetical protein n=1 Tax=Pragia fontium TaxID=82985 RepID=UPI0006496D24|nr:hypothetical protein [Pragia fontium]AKJ41792.1 hypothetical protein QQ39_06605 [Pragia fontium]